MNMNFEFKKGVFFVRLSGIFNSHCCSNLISHIIFLSQKVGLKNMVLNINNLRIVDTKQLDIIYQYITIINKHQNVIICNGALNGQLNYNNKIKCIGKEMEAFNLI